MSIQIFLKKGINRKQYALLVFLGIILTIVLFPGAILLGIYIYTSTGNDILSKIAAVLVFSIFGIYFYVIRMKRLHDIGQGSDFLAAAHSIQGAGTALDAVLFGKETEKKSSKKHKKYIFKFFHSQSEIVIILLIYFILLLFIIIMINLLGGYVGYFK